MPTTYYPHRYLVITDEVAFSVPEPAEADEICARESDGHPRAYDLGAPDPVRVSNGQHSYRYDW